MRLYIYLMYWILELAGDKEPGTNALDNSFGQEISMLIFRILAWLGRDPLKV